MTAYPADVLHIPEWRELLRDAPLTRAELFRHVLILGETGSGKTRSGVLPLLRAILAAASNEEDAPAMLLIDPKHELVDEVAQVLAHRGDGRHSVIRACSTRETRIWAFESIRLQDCTPDVFSARLMVLRRRKTTSHNGNSDFFETQAENLLRTLFAIDRDIAQHSENATEALATYYDMLAHTLARLVGADAASLLAYDPDNYLQGHFQLLNLLSLSSGVSTQPDVASIRQELLAQIVHTARVLGASPLDGVYLASLGTLAEETFTSVIASTNNVLRLAASPDLAERVSLNPFEPPRGGYLSAERAMATGAIVAYAPDGNADLQVTVGKLLKTRFFEATFRRTDRRRPFYYVCDEFQRYITNDPESGEQSYLDRCRAYGAGCILATQSISSLAYALATDSSADAGADGPALEVLLGNTGTKLFFRSTDPALKSRLIASLPEPPVAGRPHVAQVRPPTTLQVGECYYLRSNGSWGRAAARL
jgi:hypothetical protein